MASIRERTSKSGAKSWAVLWRDPDARKQTSLTFPTRGQAETLQKLLDANGQRLRIVERGLKTAASKKLTVAGLVDWHLEQPLRANSDTIAKYRSITDLHIRPRLGDVPADELGDVHLSEWADAMSSDGASRKSILNVTGLLSAAYKRGVLKGKVQANPMASFRLPSDERAPRRATFLTKKEYDLILSHIPERWHLFTDLLVQTGLRFGEATALTPDSLILDADVPIIEVRTAWKGGSGVGWRVGPPKSRESVRDVAITRPLADRLAEVPPHEDGYLFRNHRGGVLRNADYHQTGWQGAVDSARENGLRKDPRPHDLRHTHASWLLAEGVPLFVVSRRLGHASIATTSRLYGHLTPEGHLAAVAGLERALGR